MTLFFGTPTRIRQGRLAVRKRVVGPTDPSRRFEHGGTRSSKVPLNSLADRFPPLPMSLRFGSADQRRGGPHPPPSFGEALPAHHHFAADRWRQQAGRGQRGGRHMAPRIQGSGPPLNRLVGSWRGHGGTPARARYTQTMGTAC